MLLSLHTMVASFTKVEELELDAEEAKKMADAIADVASFYNAVIDPKTLAWFGLATTLGAVYGPRVASYKLRTAMEKAVKDGKTPAPVQTKVFGIDSADVPLSNVAAM